mgnify:CR=1 FL=1
MRKQELIEALNEELNEYHPEFEYDIRYGFERAIEMVEELLGPRVNGDNRIGTENNTCRWILYNDFDCVIWSSNCGLDWQFSNPETPAENEMHYCPKCGKKLEVVE